VLQLHQNPPATAVEQLWALALPEAPVAQPPLGRIETLGRLTLDDVRTFYRQHYRPAGAVLSIAGDVTPERAYAAAQEWFGSWAAGEAPVTAATPSRAPGSGRIRVVDQPGTATALAVGVLVPGRASDDALARSVAVSLFEQQLNERVARATVRDVGASLELTRDVGLWVVRAAAPADSAAVLARRLTAELKRFLAAPPAAADVAAVQRLIRRGFPLAFETAAGLMSQWQLADFAGFPADYFDGYDARVAALGPQDLAAATRRETDAERPYIVAVGPASRVAPLLQSIAPVEVVTLDRMPGSAPPPDTLGPRTAEQEAKGKKLIAQAVTAHGGRAKLAGVKTSLQDAAIRLAIPGGEVAGTLRQLRKDPNKLALVTSVQGVDTRQVLNGTRAWTVIAESDTAQEGDTLDVSALHVALISDLPHVMLSASDDRARVAARGRERVSGHDVDKVEVASSRDPWRMLYFDATTHRLLAFDQRERDERGPYLARRVFSDYRALDGIQWPYQEERFVSGQSLMKLDFTGVQLNLELEEKQFLPPKVITPWR
jgi:hypothetical protein